MTESTNLIFGRPDIVEGIGPVYPITLQDYDKFQNSSFPLYYSKAHFGKKFYEYPLLDLLMFEGAFRTNLEIIINIVTRRVAKLYVHEDTGTYGFYLDEGSSVTRDNYDVFRETVMKQNLMFEQKVYKDELTRKWAEKVINSRSKSGVRMEFEDMVTTVAAFSGKHYWDLEKYTIYQLQSEFKRISKIKGYELDVAVACANGDGSKISHFAEYLDLFRNPYDDVFVSKDKLSNLNKALS